MATTTNGSTGSITVDSNRNFIISDNVNTLEGRVETTVRDGVNFKSKHHFNANTDILHTVRTPTVESTTTTPEGLLTATVQRHISFPCTVDLWFVVNKGVQRETSYYDRSAVPNEKDHRSKWPFPSTRAK